MHCAPPPPLASRWTLGRQQTVAICAEKLIAAWRSSRIFPQERRLFFMSLSQYSAMRSEAKQCEAKASQFALLLLLFFTYIWESGIGFCPRVRELNTFALTLLSWPCNRVTCSDFLAESFERRKKTQQECLCVLASCFCGVGWGGTLRLRPAVWLSVVKWRQQIRKLSLCTII